MGITEVIAHAHGIYAKYRRLIAAIRQRRPVIAVLLGFPDGKLPPRQRRKTPPTSPSSYFVSPQLWAWKLQPPPLGAAAGLENAGHFRFFEAPVLQKPQCRRRIRRPPPPAELPPPRHLPRRLRRPRGGGGGGGGDPAEPLDCPPPRQRRWREIESQPPHLVESRPAALPARPVCAILPRLLPPSTANALPASPPAGSPPLPWHRPHGPSALHPPRRRRPSLRSTTPAPASWQAAPPPCRLRRHRPTLFVVIYRVSALTYRLGQAPRRIPPRSRPKKTPANRRPAQVAMANLIAGRRIVPELIQSSFTAAITAAAPPAPRRQRRARRTDRCPSRGFATRSGYPTHPAVTAIQRVPDAVLYLPPRKSNPARPLIRHKLRLINLVRSTIKQAVQDTPTSAVVLLGHVLHPPRRSRSRAACRTLPRLSDPRST